MDTQVQFFFDSVEKVDGAIAAKRAAHNYVLMQLRLAAIGLGLEFSGAHSNYRHFEIPKLIGLGAYYTVIFDELFVVNHKLRIAIELEEKTFDYIGKMDQILAGEISDSGFFIKRSNECGHIYYISKEYTVNVEQIQKLSYVIIDFLERDFKQKMEVIITILKDAKA